MARKPLLQAVHDPERTRLVFLVQGRNHAANTAITGLLESVGLRVLEWEQAVQYAIARTGDGSPYIGDIVTEGMSRCHAVVVLFTPDDIGSLHPSLWEPDGPAGVDQQLAGRARQNVVFEAGIALGRDTAPTVLVEFGSVVGFSDIAGRHAVRLDDSPKQRKALLDRLAVLGCNVDLTGSRWMSAGDLAGALTTLEAYRLVPVEDDSGGTPEPGAQFGHLASSPVTQWYPTEVNGLNPTDLVVASVVQVPAGPGISHDPQRGLATVIRGDQREDRLVGLLADSPLTSWLDGMRESFRIHPGWPLPEWAVTGHNSGEWSELALEPPGPISVHCKVNTGWIFDGQERVPGLVMFTELRFRLLELDESRLPGTIRHATTPAPVPGALSLDETFDALVAALRVVDTAAAAYTALTGAMAGTGQAALWLASFGGPVDRVIDLREFRLIPGSFGVSEQSTKVSLSFDAKTGKLSDEPALRRAAVQLLSELLERSGRRGASERLEILERPAR